MQSVRKKELDARPDFPVVSTVVTGEGQVHGGCRTVLSAGWSRRSGESPLDFWPST